MSHQLERLKMKNSKNALVALAAVLAANAAFAQSMFKNSDFYSEVGYSAIKFDDGYTTATPKLVRFVVGTSINANFDVEGAVALTGSKGDLKDSTENGKLSAKHIGFYAKPKMEIVKDTEVFGRIGISHTSWKANNSVGERSDSFTKLAYGIGIQTQFTKDVYGQVDYMDSGKKDGVSAKGLTVSIGTRF
jgi:opacity protein-like surface antigen